MIHKMQHLQGSLSFSQLLPRLQSRSESVLLLFHIHPKVLRIQEYSIGSDLRRTGQMLPQEEVLLPDSVNMSVTSSRHTGCRSLQLPKLLHQVSGCTDNPRCPVHRWSVRTVPPALYPCTGSNQNHSAGQDLTNCYLKLKILQQRQ